MVLKILAHDLTGGWHVGKYNAQTGHVVRLKTDYPTCDIKKITWYLSNGEISHERVIDHVFVRDGGSGSIVPGEGFITVKVKIVNKSGEKHFGCRKFLISPVVDCDIFFEDYIITNTTKCIKLVGAPLCAQLNMGTPFNPNPCFACGGACPQDCPTFEIIATPLSGTKIKYYGKHKISSKLRIDGGVRHDLCIPLYKNNTLAKCSRYPPLVKRVVIEPRNLNLEVTPVNGSEKVKKITINNLSEYMFPCSAKIKWSIYYEDELEKCICMGKKDNPKTLKYRFDKVGNYKVKAKIMIKNCNPICVVATFMNNNNWTVSNVNAPISNPPVESEEEEEVPLPEIPVPIEAPVPV